MISNGNRIIRRIFLMLFFFVLLAAIMQMSININDVLIFAPYVPFLIMMGIFVPYWLLRPLRVLVRREEYVFFYVQIMIMLLALISDNPWVSMSASLMAIYIINLYWITRYCFRTRIINNNNLMVFAIIIFIILTVIAFLQFIFQSNIGVAASYFGENLAAGSYTQGGYVFRISSSFTNPNVFAYVYTLYSSIVIAILLFNKKSSRFYSALFISGISTFVIALSLSRGGMLGIILVQMALYSFWILLGGRNRGSRMIVFTSLIFGGIVSLLIIISLVDGDLVPGVSRLLQTDIEEDGAAVGRIVVYEGAVQLLAQDPSVLMFGTGKGQFYAGMAEYGIYPDYKAWIPAEDNRGSAHNWFLMVLSEHGLFVCFLYIYVIHKTILRGWFLRKKPKGWLPASLSIILASLYLSSFQFTPAGMTVWLMTPIVVLFVWIQHEYDFHSKSYIH